MGESERRQSNRRAKDNGWHEAKALVMDKLETVGTDVKDLRDDVKDLREHVEGKYHVAPCLEIGKVKEDSGKQAERIKALERNREETRRSFRWLIGIMLTMVGLLLGLYGGG